MKTTTTITFDVFFLFTTTELTNTQEHSFVFKYNKHPIHPSYCESLKLTGQSIQYPCASYCDKIDCWLSPTIDEDDAHAIMR